MNRVRAFAGTHTPIQEYVDSLVKRCGHAVEGAAKKEPRDLLEHEAFAICVLAGAPMHFVVRGDRVVMESLRECYIEKLDGRFIVRVPKPKTTTAMSSPVTPVTPTVEEVPLMTDNEVEVIVGARVGDNNLILLAKEIKRRNALAAEADPQMRKAREAEAKEAKAVEAREAKEDAKEAKEAAKEADEKKKA